MGITLPTFRARVKWLLEQPEHGNGMSQKELAAAIRLSEQFTGALILGKRNPNVSHLQRMAKALKTSVSFLALTTDDPAPETAEDGPVYLSPEAADAAQQRGSRADMLAEVAARGPAMLTTEDTAAANAWLRRYVRVFVADNQVTEVRFNFW